MHANKNFKIQYSNFFEIKITYMYMGSTTIV